MHLQPIVIVRQGLLDLSKIEAGKLATEQIETPLPQILVEVESLMRPRVSSKNLELRTLLETLIPNSILSDPTRLRQILINLVGNAAKFTDEGSIEVRVRADRRDGQSNLRVEVEDTGAGMTPDQAASLFRPFTQGDISVTRKHGGTGLGLTISRRLAQMMGGDVRLDYSEPGRGSRFVLELPLIAAPGSSLVQNLDVAAEEKKEAAGEKAVTLSGRILLAEDGDFNQRLISLILVQAGAEVEIAEDGRIALEMLGAAAAKGRPFDLLLSDMQMPEMDGYTLAKTLRANGSRIPIVALTAHAMCDDRQKCLDAGCNDYASKPIDRSVLLTTCRQWIERGKVAVAAEIPSIASTDGNADHQLGHVEVLVSELADDPNLAEIVDEFLDKLGPKVGQMNEHFSAHRLNDLGRLAHQLKGAGGGYGFPSISAAARQVEQRATAEHDMDQLQLAVDELNRLCQQAIAGRTVSESALAGA